MRTKRRSIVATRLENVGRAPPVSALLGFLLGELLPRVPGTRFPTWLGAPWAASATGARSAIATMLGVEVTALGFVLSVAMVLYQSTSSQYSPRLVPLLVRGSGLRPVLTLFIFSGAYGLAAVHGLGSRSGVHPAQPVAVGVAFLLLVLCLGALLVELVRTVIALRPERIVARVTEESIEAIDRFERRWSRWSAVEGAIDEQLPRGVPLFAPSTGYLREIDADRLARWTKRGAIRIRIDRDVGAYVTEDDVLGFVSGDGVGALTARQLRAIAASVVTVGTSRDPRVDALYGLRLLADVADRALSPAINDPYTGMQALHAAQAPLRRLARAKRGDLVLKRGGRTVARAASPALADYVRVTVDGPLRYGAADPDLLGAVLELAAALGRAGSQETREIAHALVAQVLTDAGERRMDVERLARLRAHADSVDRAIDHDHDVVSRSEADPGKPAPVGASAARQP